LKFGMLRDFANDSVIPACAGYIVAGYLLLCNPVAAIGLIFKQAAALPPLRGFRSASLSAVFGPALPKLARR
jgi:hypothetical protein